MTDTPMKPGAGDDPFADDDQPASQPEPTVPEEPTDDVVEAIPKADLDVPWDLLRDNVRPSRDGGMIQIELTEETDAFDDIAEEVINRRFEATPYTMDRREAIYLAGMMHLDDVERVLREWGHGYEEE